MSNPTLDPNKIKSKPLPASLRSIIERLEGVRKFAPSQVRKIILEAGVEPKDLQPWADFDHPAEDSYGRKLVYKGDNFEIMVMSWRPGDISTIHDHGHTQWGCVQVFGPAEHATFRLEDDQITTLSRVLLKPRQAIGVSHSLLHQMGNPTRDTFFLTLHVYGELEEVDNVTGDARVFDLENGTIQRVDGGVFFALPPHQIKEVEAGPQGDFPTRLRHLIELARRLYRIEARGGANPSDKNLKEVIEQVYSGKQRTALLDFLAEITDEEGHQTHSALWKVLNWELKEAGKLQHELQSSQRPEDPFYQYAEWYDDLIGRPSLESFMAEYLGFVQSEYGIDLADKTLISLGCGTGLVEEYLIREHGLRKENVFGLDLSEAMVAVAGRRIDAALGDVLALDPGVRLWDLAFSGLNVFQYLEPRRLEEAIHKTAAILQPGGLFFGDFITPDHLRWYPNMVHSGDQEVISLRSPELIERSGSMFLRSDIVNLCFREGKMKVSCAGKHDRFLPPVNRVRTYFEKAFGGRVDLYDAITLEPIPEWADSCVSTRYLVVAQKS